MPTPGQTTGIPAVEVARPKSSHHCGTSMDDGTRKIVMDVSVYTHCRPGGKAQRVPPSSFLAPRY